MSAGAFRCGHDRAPHNVYTDSKGLDRCRACKRQQQRKWRAGGRVEHTATGSTWLYENKSPATIADDMEAATKLFLARLWSEHPGIMRHAQAAGRQVVRP